VVPDFLVLIFWMWFAAAVFVLVRRLATTGTFRADGDAGKERVEAERHAAANRHAEFEAQLAASSQMGPLTRQDHLLPAAARARTLAEAMDGIRMPADLVPIPTEQPNPRHLFFATTTATAEDVGTSLADELGRLGFELSPVDDQTITAVQPHARVEVRILAESGPRTPGLVAGRVAPERVIAEFELC